MTKKRYITGKVEGITKKELKDLIKPDFEMTSGVIKSLDLLVTAEEPGEKRIKTAKEYGIVITKWEDFLNTANLEKKSKNF